MNQETTNIGRRIYDLRIERDILQGDLAQAIHLHQSVLNRIEKGTRPARDNEIRAIALYFHVTADELLGIPASAASGDATATLLPFSLSAEEQAFLKKYRSLDDRGQRAVDAALLSECRYLAEHCQQKNA